MEKFNSKNYSAWKIRVIDKVVFENMDSRERAVYFCKLAHLAPSTHNSQPWRFFIDNEGCKIMVYLDRKYVLPASDVCGRQAVISVGCAIENIVIAAQHFDCLGGIKINNLDNENALPIRKSQKGPRFILLAIVGLRHNRASVQKGLREEGENFLSSMISRKVVRAEFDMQRPIPKSILNELKDIPDGKSIGAKIIKGGPSKAMISEFQGQADGYVINSKKFSKELGDWLLPNNSKSGLGMPGIGFGLQDEESLRIHKGLAGKDNLRPEDGLKFSIAGKRGMESSPIVVVLTARKDNIEHWIRAGQIFERMFLLLNGKNINVAVHAGIVEVGLVNRLFSTMLGAKGRIAVLFRAGWVKNKDYTNRPHSPRMPLEFVLFDKKPYT